MTEIFEITSLLEKRGIILLLLVVAIIMLIIALIYDFLQRLFTVKNIKNDSVLNSMSFNNILIIGSSTFCIILSVVFYRWMNNVILLVKAVGYYDDLIKILVNIIVVLSIIMGLFINNAIDKYIFKKIDVQKDDVIKIRFVSSINIFFVVFFCYLVLKVMINIELMGLYFSFVLGRFVFYDFSISSVRHSFEGTRKFFIDFIVADVVIIVILLMLRKTGVVSDSNAIVTLAIAMFIFVFGGNVVLGVSGELVSIIKNLFEH